MFHRPAPILAQYSRGRVDLSLLRRAGVTGAKVLLAAAYGALVVMLPPSAIVWLAMPIVAMLLLTLWMLPDRATFPLVAIERVFLVFLVLSVLWPVYLAVDLPGLPWATPTRMALLALSFLLLYSVSTSSALRNHLLTVARASGGMWTAFLLWEAMQVITLPFSVRLSESLRKLFDNQFQLVGVMFIGMILFSRPGWASRAIKLLIFLAVVASIDGLIELRLGAPPWSNYIPSFLRVDEGLLANVLGSQARTADGLYRVRGPFLNSLLFAEFLALCVPFVVHEMVTARTLWKSFVMFAAFVIIFEAILTTQSRLGLVGVVVTILAYLPLWALRRWRADKSGLLGPSIVLGFPVIAVVMMVAIVSSNTLSVRILGGGAAAASTESRRIQREMAVPRILHNPIGYGLGQCGTVLGFTNPGGYLTIDSGFISTVLDIGVIGFFSFFGLCGLAAYHGARLFLQSTDRELQLGGPLAVTMIVFITIKFVLSQENNHYIVFLLIAMQLAFLARQRKLVDADGLVHPRPPLGSARHVTPSALAPALSVARISG